MFPFKHTDRCFLIVGRPERYKLMVHQVGHGIVWGSQKQGPDVDVINQHTLLIYDIHEGKGFTVLSMRSDVLQRVLQRPLFSHRNVVGRHQSADAAFWISKEGNRNSALLRR